MFDGKRVLVTGSSRGLGWATGKAFLEVGARVAVNGRTAESTSAGIEKMGGGERLFAAPGDVGTVAGCESVVGAAVDALGGLDVLVNSAGVAATLPIEEANEALWDAIIMLISRVRIFAAERRCQPCVRVEAISSISPRLRA